MKNIFDLHNDILNDYKLYIESFINIADKRILDTVKKDFDSGNLYPEPLVQFNPSFESGGKVEDLVNDGVLVADFNDIFYDETGSSWSIYKHQAQAIIKGNEEKDFIVTSGTGSGKSLIYISTIFNHLFKNPGKPGIKAILVYPLNALINSQETALKGFEENYRKRTGHGLPFKFAKYTGQEDQEIRKRLSDNPPDILLTNYMMLELLMVRKADEELRKSFLNNLKYLVFDELHVYKGRQGADVSLLIRRIKASASNKDIICIGTSATMASGTIEEQKTEVAKVASRFFDSTFAPENIIVESLTYSTKEVIPTNDQLRAALVAEINDKSRETILTNPIAIWLERTIAVRNEGDNKRRNEPKSLKTIAAELSDATGVIVEVCEKRIIEVLIWAETINIESTKEKKKDTILPFKLHQFISQTGYVYLTLENAENRFITLEPNPFVKLSEDKPEVPVYQTVFSRISGEEFICVRKDIGGEHGKKLIFRDFNENQNPRNEDDLKTNDMVEKPSRLPELVTALETAAKNVRRCTICGNLSEAEHCPVCADERRRSGQVCVVEYAQDLAAIERSGAYRGRYHVLHGKLSPIRGVTPEDLNLGALIQRITAGEITELILALSNDVEGEATCHYLTERLPPSGVKVTRIGFGLPSGSGVLYADAVTLKSALEGRRDYS